MVNVDDVVAIVTVGGLQQVVFSVLSCKLGQQTFGHLKKKDF